MITDPKHPTLHEDGYKSIRGCSLFTNTSYVEVDRMHDMADKNEAENVGFRIVMSITDMKALMESNHDH